MNNIPLRSLTDRERKVMNFWDESNDWNEILKFLYFKEE